jgi:hypothetical protein
MPACALLVLILFLSTALAQTSPSGAAKDDTEGIHDNSFLIEEAYNQDEGVVQHINTFSRQNNGDWIYVFTQEWPVFSRKHQLSYTIPVQGLSNPEADFIRFGVVALNYRYQLVGSDESRLAIAPRFSLLVPFGSVKEDPGSGSVGAQLSLPASLVISEHLVTHWNAGITLTPSAANNSVARTGHTDGYVGQSFVWLAKPRFNVLLESLWLSQETVIAPGVTRRSNSFLLNPGIRWAYNFKNGLQIVPGISIPTGLGSDKLDRGFLLYLSFEHPFRKRKE